jgi:Glycine zipper
MRSNRTARLLEFLMFSIMLFAGSAVAQSGDMYIYPAKGQDKNKQDEDRYDCHSWAVSQTGFDPSKPQAITPSSLADQQYRPSQPHVLRGGARGAALGAVGGAITGDAGKGAAAGAAMGGLAGGFRRRDEKRQQAYQQQTNAQSAQQNQRVSYNRAMAACLEGRGYTVK